MSTDRLTVLFCCNDDAGKPRLFVEAVEVVDIERLIQLKGPTLYGRFSYELAEMTPIEWTLRNVKVAGEMFGHRGRRPHVGGLRWDSAMILKAEVVRLLNHLATLDGWSCTEAETSLFKAWGEREITVEDLERAIGS